MDPAVAGAAISGGVAIVLQLINWGRESTSARRTEQQARETINQQRVDELRGILEEAARALRDAHELLRGATRTGPRDTADATHVEYAAALRRLGDLHTRMAVRLGQTDPLVQAYRDGHAALDSVLPLIESMRGPHQGFDLTAEDQARILEANRAAAASELLFEHQSASVVGPELTVRTPRGDRPLANASRVLGRSEAPGTSGDG